MNIEVDYEDLSVLISGLGYDENCDLLTDWVYECHSDYDCNVKSLLANSIYVCLDSDDDVITYMEENNLIDGENCIVYNCDYGTLIDLDY